LAEVVRSHIPPVADVRDPVLRVLQEHEFERVGGTGSIRTNTRVIATTNRDLEAAVAAGIFRSDFSYRLNVFPIEVPPLRERKEDIPVLIEYFIDRYARSAGKIIQEYAKRAWNYFGPTLGQETFANYKTS